MAQATAHPNHQLISSEDVKGTEVYENAGNTIGEIDHLMIDKTSGRVAYAVMSFGGFLGLGHSRYPVPLGVLSSMTPRLAASARTSPSSSLRTRRSSAMTPGGTENGRRGPTDTTV